MKRIKIAFTLLCFCSLALSIVAQKNFANEPSFVKDYFQTFVKVNQPISEIGFPFVGDTHFTDYKYVDSRNDLLRYNYFLVGADIYPAFYLFDNKKNPFNLRLSFGTKIRVWNKRRSPLRTNYEWHSSHAIKTPSFLPGAFFSYLLNHSQEKENVKLNYLEIGFTHHSNGQDAPTLASQDSTLNLPEGMKYNIEDGDFSANNLTIKYFMTQNNPAKHFLSQAYYFKLDAIGSGKFDHDDLHQYIIGLEHRFIKWNNAESRSAEKFKVLINASLGIVSFNDIDLSESISYSISYHHRLPFSSQISVFAKYGYLGQDDYNIYLERSLHYFRFGLSMSNINLN